MGDLRVLAAGSQPPNPARLLSSRRMGSLLATLSEQADIVVVDTPPLLSVSDAVPLLERVSGTVLVAKVGATSRDALQRMRQVIETARGNLLGAVATGSGKSGLYGYGGDYYEAEDAGPDERGPIVDRPAGGRRDRRRRHRGRERTGRGPPSRIARARGGRIGFRPHRAAGPGRTRLLTRAVGSAVRARDYAKLATTRAIRPGPATG